MKSWSNHKQHGLSLVSFIVLLAILGFLAVVAMKVVPTVTEYMAVKKAIQAAKSVGPAPAAIRAKFDQQANVGYITSISGKDLEVTADDGNADVSFLYEKRISLAGPVSLLIEYQGSTSTRPLIDKDKQMATQ